MAKRNSKKTNQKKTTVAKNKVLGYLVPAKIEAFITSVPPLLIVAVITLLYFIIQLSVFVPHYQTNDDVGMLFIASGTGSSIAPDEHLRYSHIFLGFLLKTLFSITRNIPWYGLYHYLVHCISILALGYSLLSQRRSLRNVMLFILYLFTIELYFLNHIQFTMTACVAAQAGVFLFLTAMRDRSSISWFQLAISFFLLLASFLVRANAFFLSMLVASVIVAVPFFKGRDNRRYLIIYAAFWIVLAVAVLGLRSYERSYYANDTAWSDFFSFSKMKSRFIDYVHIEYNSDTKHIFDEVGWSENDFHMMRTWFHDDIPIYSTENLRKITEQFPEIRANMTVYRYFERVGDALSSAWLFLVMAVFFTIFIFRDRSAYGAVAATFLMILLVMSYLIIAKRLPDRVLFPMMAFLAYTALFSGGYSSIRYEGSYMTVASVSTLLLFVFISSFLTEEYKIGQSVKRERESFHNSVERLAPVEDDLYLVWGAAVPWESLSPFDTLSFMRDWKLIILGTTLRTPITKARKEQFGIDNLYKALYEHDNINIIIRNIRYLYIYRVLVNEHYGVDLKFKNEFASNDFNVVKVGLIEEGDSVKKKVFTGKTPYRR